MADYNTPFLVHDPNLVGAPDWDLVDTDPAVYAADQATKHFTERQDVDLLRRWDFPRLERAFHVITFEQKFGEIGFADTGSEDED